MVITVRTPTINTARDRLILDHDLLPFFGRMAVGDVTPSEVHTWIASLTNRPLSPSSVRRAFTVLDQLLASAVDLGLIAASPQRARASHM